MGPCRRGAGHSRYNQLRASFEIKGEGLGFGVSGLGLTRVDMDFALNVPTLAPKFQFQSASHDLKGAYNTVLPIHTFVPESDGQLLLCTTQHPEGVGFREYPPCNSGITGIEEDPNIVPTIPSGSLLQGGGSS